MKILILSLISEYTLAFANKLLKSVFVMVLKRSYFLRGQCVMFHIGHILLQDSLFDIKINSL